jgi:hypothetical protein
MQADTEGFASCLSVLVSQGRGASMGIGHGAWARVAFAVAATQYFYKQGVVNTVARFRDSPP